MKQQFNYKNQSWILDYGLEWETYESVLQKLFPDKTWLYNQTDDYQGEWAAVGYDSEGFWFQQGSFGSCSGCDLLQGIDTMEEAIDFLHDMDKIAFMGKTKEDALSYLQKEEINLPFIDFTQIFTQLIKLKAIPI